MLWLLSLPTPPLAWFSNPIMLWGLGAASIPIIIHLLNKRKYREMPWAAMRFLLAALQKNRRRVRLEQWLLLAVRTLLVILVVLAMAKPVLESQGAIPLLPGQRTHWVLVLDGSMSMNHVANGSTRFDEAKALAGQLVKAARQGDGISVLQMGDPPRIVIGAPSFNHAETLKEIAGASPSHARVDLAASFLKIKELLDSSDIPRKEVVLISDLQKASWDQPDPNREAMKLALSRLSDGSVRSSVIDIGNRADTNRAVVDLVLDPPAVTPSIPVAIRATIRDFTPGASGSVISRLIVDGRVIRDQEVTLGADGDASLAFPYRFDAPGDHVIEVQMDADAQPVDDRRYAAVPVRESVRVLLVDGDPQADPFKSETAFLSEAVSPSAIEGVTELSTPVSPIEVEVIPESQLIGRDLSTYDVIALCNIARFTETEATGLESFLRQGGGLVVFGGDQVVPENYNQLLYRGGEGLLPAEVGETVGEIGQGIDPFRFDALGFFHPILSLFYGEQPGVTASLTNVKTARYQKLAVPAGSIAKVALAFTSGDPAIVEAPRFRGRVVQVATSADTGWTSWPLHRSYPAVMEQIMLLAASGRASERNVRVGQPLIQAFPAGTAGSRAALRGPNGTESSVELQPDGDVSQMRFDGTDLSGVTIARIGPPVDQEIAFAINVDPLESDPAKLNAADLRAAIPGWTFVYDDDWRPLKDDAASLGQRGEFHRPLLWAVLGLILTESFLAWKFSHHLPRMRS